MTRPHRHTFRERVSMQVYKCVCFGEGRSHGGEQDEGVRFVLSGSAKCASLVLSLWLRCGKTLHKSMSESGKCCDAGHTPRTVCARQTFGRTSKWWDRPVVPAGSSRRQQRARAEFGRPGAVTEGHSISCSRTQSLRPCYWCRPSFYHRSLAGTGSTRLLVARRRGCTPSRCRSPRSAPPGERKTPHI